MTQIFLDESGYTGPNLLDFEQPHFILGTIMGNDSEMDDLRSKFFSDVKSKEIKHSKIRKSPNQRNELIKFLKDDFWRARIKIAAADKEFALVCKLVDNFIEPAMHESGIDLYENGGNIATANVIYCCFRGFNAMDFYYEMLRNFQELTINPSERAYDIFFKHIFENELRDELDKLLALVKGAHLYLNRDLSLISKSELDVYMSSSLLLMAKWRNQIDGSINLFHDENKDMSTRADIWTALTSPDNPPQTLGYDSRTMKFPIAIDKTEFLSSNNSIGIQLADVVSGAYTYYAKWVNRKKPGNDEYGCLLNEIFSNYEVLGLFPSMETDPEKLNTAGKKKGDFFDYFATNITPKISAT